MVLAVTVTLDLLAHTAKTECRIYSINYIQTVVYVLYSFLAIQLFLQIPKSNFCENVNCNNGNCISNTFSFTCVCNSGYEGDFCDADINECIRFNLHSIIIFECESEHGFKTRHLAENTSPPPGGAFLERCFDYGPHF